MGIGLDVKVTSLCFPFIESGEPFVCAGDWVHIQSLHSWDFLGAEVSHIEDLPCYYTRGENVNADICPDVGALSICSAGTTARACNFNQKK